MGQSNSVQKCNFEDIQRICCNGNLQNYILINTLPSNQQTCLIQNTVSIENEETQINHFLSNKSSSSVYIFIYGKNTRCIYNF